MVRRYNKSEPRNPELAQPYRYQSSDSSIADLACMVSMGCSGLAMITRFAFWPWMGVLFAISSILGTKSLGTNKKTGEQGGMLSGTSALLFALTSMFSIYTPLLTGVARKTADFGFGFGTGLTNLPRTA